MRHRVGHAAGDAGLGRADGTGNDRILTAGTDPGDRRRISYGLTETGLRLIPVLLEIAEWSAGAGPETDAPAEWIATVAENKPAMIELITTTVRTGGSIFAGDDSVIARLDPRLSGNR